MDEPTAATRQHEDGERAAQEALINAASGVSFISKAELSREILILRAQVLDLRADVAHLKGKFG